MTPQEIKSYFSLPDIVAREGIEVNKAGFCDCIFHKEKTASMRIYKDHYYTYCCQRSGDVISFIQNLHNLPFREACERISGEALETISDRQRAILRMRAKDRRRKAERVLAKRKTAGNMVAVYRRKLERIKPTMESDDWMDAFREATFYFSYWCYVQDELEKVKL